MSMPVTLHEFSFVNKYREFNNLFIFDFLFGQAIIAKS
jgi:hypothetical protein